MSATVLTTSTQQPPTGLWSPVWKQRYNARRRLSSPFICSGSSSQPADKDEPQTSTAALWVTGYPGACVDFIFTRYTITFGLSVRVCLSVREHNTKGTIPALLRLNTKKLVHAAICSVIRTLHSLVHKSLGHFFQWNVGFCVKEKDADIFKWPANH